MAACLVAWDPEGHTMSLIRNKKFATFPFVAQHTNVLVNTLYLPLPSVRYICPHLGSKRCAVRGLVVQRRRHHIKRRPKSGTIIWVTLPSRVASGRVGYAVLNARVDVSCGAAYAAICCSSRAIVYALASSLWAISSVWPMGPPDVRMWFPSAQTLISIDCQGMLREIVYHSTAYAALCHAVDHMSPSASASSKPVLTSMYPVTCWGPR